MKNALRRTGALVAAAALMVGLTACGGNNEADAANPTETPAVEVPAVDAEAEEFLAEIVAGCLAEAPGQEAYCECSAQWFGTNFSVSDIEGMPMSELADAMVSAATDCMHLLDLGELDFDFDALGDLGLFDLTADEEAFWTSYFEAGMSSCLAEAPGQDLYCECSLFAVFESFTMDELTAMSIDELTEVSIAAAMECMDLIG